MKATDWTGHSWRERVFCCIALLNMEGFLTPLEHARVVKRAEAKFNVASPADSGCPSEKTPVEVARGKPGGIEAATFNRSDDNVRWPAKRISGGKAGDRWTPPEPFMFKRQAD